MTGQTSFLQALGWAILNSLWQLAILWVLYQCITGVFKNAKSSFRSSLASSLLMTGFGWFLYTFLSSLLTSAGEEKIISSVFVNPAANESVNVWLKQTLPVASLVYLALLIFPLLHFIRNYRYVQVIRRYGLTRIGADWRVFVAKVASQMNIRRKVQIWVSEFVSSPVTIGFLKPVILVPLAAINHLTPQQLEAVLLHELSHIRRHDYLINLLITIIQSVLYFNPFVKAFVKIIEREREKSCDEMVLQFQYNAHDYAKALLTLEQANHEKKFVIAASGKKADLLHRVERIMGVQKNRSFSFQKMAGLLAGLLCIIALQALLLFVNKTNGRSIADFPRVYSSSRSSSTPIQAEAARKGTVNNTKSTQGGVATRTLKNILAPANAAESTFGFAGMNTDFIQASLEFANSPELKQYQEQQVDYALEASRKVLESIQWKMVEKNIADVFTQKEKEVLKATYEKQIKKLDWTKYENKLKLAYNNIDWEKVNAQLSTAVEQVRLDSIQTVYYKALDKMDDVRHELRIRDMHGIPDTDVSLKVLDTKRTEVRKALNDMKATKVKKIVHL